MESASNVVLDRVLIHDFVDSSFDVAGILGSDGTGTSIGASGNQFISIASEDFHLAGTAVEAIDLGTDLSAQFIGDIDAFASRIYVANWDIGADEALAATEVTLVSFTATGLDSAVLLEWQTSSELDNLGFHLYQALAEEGPYERITASLIPGGSELPGGSSPSLIIYGDPTLVSFRELERGRRHVILVSETEAFSQPGLYPTEPARVVSSWWKTWETPELLTPWFWWTGS